MNEKQKKVVNSIEDTHFIAELIKYHRDVEITPVIEIIGAK